MLELEEAVTRILSFVLPAQTEEIATSLAHGRIATQTVVSPSELPPFDNSAMDGYAARSEDVRSAAKDAPVTLEVTGSVAAGEIFTGRINPGRCARVFTGSALPPGTDCVIMQEDTRPARANTGQILILEPARPWENVRFKGEDVHAGGALLTAGQALTAGHLCLLSATGVDRVTVGRQPTVGLIATGSELREAGQDLGPGQIYESNRAGLAALVRSAGAQPLVLPLVPDNAAATEKALSDAFANCHIVVSAGGASVGDFDLVKPSLIHLGGQVEFWKVAIRPGRPFVFGRFDQRLFFGLPGNPVSALVTFLLLVRPALRRWQGAAETQLRQVSGMLAQDLANPGTRRHFVRVRLSPAGEVSLAGTQSSHVLSSFAEAGGLVDVPPQSTLKAGSSVGVKVWEP